MSVKSFETQINKIPDPTPFQPKINKNSGKIADQRVRTPIFERTQKDLEKRNLKIEAMKAKQDAERVEKERQILE